MANPAFPHLHGKHASSVHPIHLAHYLFGGDADYLTANSLGILVVGAADAKVVVGLAETNPTTPIIVVDTSPANTRLMLNSARRHALTHVSVLYTETYNIDELFTMNPGKFGLVVLNYSLHEVPDPASFLNRVSTLMRRHDYNRGGVLIYARAFIANAPLQWVMELLQLSGVHDDIESISDVLCTVRSQNSAHSAARSGAAFGRRMAHISNLNEEELHQLVRRTQGHPHFSIDEVMNMLTAAEMVFSGWAPTQDNTKLVRVQSDMGIFGAVHWPVIAERQRAKIAHRFYGNIHSHVLYARPTGYVPPLRPGPHLAAWPIIPSPTIEEDLWEYITSAPNADGHVVLSRDVTVAPMRLCSPRAAMARALYHRLVQRPRAHWSAIRSTLLEASGGYTAPDSVDALASTMVEHGFLRFTTTHVDALREPVVQRPSTPIDPLVVSITDDDDSNSA